MNAPWPRGPGKGRGQDRTGRGTAGWPLNYIDWGLTTHTLMALGDTFRGSQPIWGFLYAPPPFKKA